jgi:hypothetical protein
MKKIISSVLLLFIVISLSAQTKITKAGVVGKWGIVSVEMPGMVYYNVDKDSIAVGEVMKAQLKEPAQMQAFTTMLKQQLAPFFKTSFWFKDDGTAELVAGETSPEKATYKVDEVNSTIITYDSNKAEESQKAEMIGELLRITSKQPQGDVIMTLKKIKP